MQKGNSLVYWTKVVSLGMVLGLGLQFAQAWTAPTQAPPAGNIAGPVTLEIDAQYKTGYLGVATLSTPLYPLTVGGDAMISGKIYATSTISTDLGATLTTKDYVDLKIANSAPTIPICTGSGKALQWTGSQFSCVDIAPTPSPTPSPAPTCNAGACFPVTNSGGSFTCCYEWMNVNGIQTCGTTCSGN